MRRRRAALAVLATAVLSLLIAAFAGSAAAGGPTSVLLVVPGEGRTASLYTGSSDYDQLARLVGAFNTPTGSTTPPPGAGNGGPAGTVDDSGPGVTLTWLMHDVTIWRVDRVYIDAKGGPWISTQMSVTGGDIWAEPAVWHTASGGKALATLLDRLAVGPVAAVPAPNDSPATAAAGTGTSSQASGGQPNTTSSTAATRGRDTGLPGPDGWIWGLAGVVFGVVLTRTVRRWRAGAAAADRSDDSEAPDPTEAQDGPHHPAAEVPLPADEPEQEWTETLSSHEADVAGTNSGRSRSVW
jgi:hypothetical protein